MAAEPGSVQDCAAVLAGNLGWNRERRALHHRRESRRRNGSRLPRGCARSRIRRRPAGVLGTCRALIAPVATGGGVRVKILDAASKGLPVVGTSAAVGSLGSIFELPTFDDPEQFVAECRRYLLDRNTAVKAGERLYDLNAERWDERAPHTSVASLIGASLPGNLESRP
ncbi:MAG: hypothetical protein WBA81_07705 [Rhodococcus sp. (in: high G+C Gram-positive bacteria)]